MSREVSSSDSGCPTCTGAKKKDQQVAAMTSEDLTNDAGDRIIHIETMNNGTQIITVFHGVTGEEIGTWSLAK